MTDAKKAQAESKPIHSFIRCMKLFLNLKSDMMIFG